MDYTTKMLFEFARMLNNYRNFESDEDIYNLIDQFLTSYNPYDQPERSKREDSTLWLTCPECKNIDIVFKHNAKFWECPGCKL